jgi:hypothetical protein
MIYVGCALALAPPDFIEQVLRLKSNLKKEFQILDFYGFTGTADEVFAFDMKQVNSCHKMLAICDYPSTGLGFEIASVLQRNLPVIAVAHREAVVSRMIIGISHKKFSFHRYDDIEKEIPALLR